MSSHDLQSSRRIWTEYWRSGRGGCLTDEAPVSARKHLAALWRAWFLDLPRGARIVDLACGSGEVARIALSTSAEARLAFNIEGVDLADGIGGTDRAGNGTTLHLLGGVDLCRLPFPADSFDCAVSQFGIEYGDVEGACCEVARVLKPASRGLFLVHHSESAITSAARARLQAFAYVIGNGMAFDRARQVYEGIAHGAGESAAATQLSEFRQSLRDALAVHSTECPWETNLREILHFLSDLARSPQIYDPFDALRRLAAARDMIAAWKSRQESQLAAARDEAGMRVFAETMRRSAMEPGDISVVKDPASDAVLAWRLTIVATGSR